MIRSGKYGLGDERHPGQRTDRQRGLGRADSDLQLRGCKAVTAIARRTQALDRVGERMRIDMDLGAELRGEQCQGQHPANQPKTFSDQVPILRPLREYPSIRTDLLYVRS